MGLFMREWGSEPEGGGLLRELIPLWENLGAGPRITMSPFEEMVTGQKCQRNGGQRT